MTATYPPGPQGAPLLGSLREFASDRIAFLTHARDTYGDIAHWRIGPRHLYLLSKPDDVRYVLVDGAAHFEKTPMFKRGTRRVIGEGLLTSEGELHKRQRRLMQPTFNHARIAPFAETIVARTVDAVNGWRDGETRDMHQEMTHLTLAIVAETLFGADVSMRAEAVGKAIEQGMQYTLRRTSNLLNPPDWLPTPTTIREKRNAAVLDEVVMGMIDARRQARDERGNLLSLLLEASDDTGKMSDKQVRDEVMTLFIAGHETTANALVWTLYLLARHPAAAAVLRTELDSVLGDRAPTFADVPQLAYTDMVVQESMRLFPPAWIIPRVAVDDVELSGYTIRAGSVVLSCPYTMHHDPRLFSEPERFMPERFAPDCVSTLPRYAYFPFGGGPRVCIGNGFAMLEARLALATIMQRYQFDLPDGYHVQLQPLVTLRPRGGLPMTLHRRGA